MTAPGERASQFVLTCSHRCSRCELASFHSFDDKWLFVQLSQVSGHGSSHKLVAAVGQLCEYLTQGHTRQRLHQLGDQGAIAKFH